MGTRFRASDRLPTAVARGVLGVVTTLLLACPSNESSDDGVIETVEVEPARTTLLTTIYDQAAPERREAFSGVLPSDFPADLPLYDPSNLTDFGDAEEGRYVLLFSPDASTLVRDRMEVELARSGWTRIEGDAARGTYRRGSRAVVLGIRDANPGTEILVEY
ncbi:MAG: hypothetical protein R3244_01185 [Thermoanaerobaculia bacterium]|nr:hypothetical protein [Thermoanaerobaculia bacterium]